ncbi:hypothetical protein MPNT_10326 [Candidatus Methylacidithermus pantelleriae]|uniref:Uncharacterized protein n=1 Tax=Candidatus Methylacidithermus pantelleriae TaxID=2744239 RepID=A0A8J2BG20_9BACT|nr:hypothetical protein MPNT_10326 [Candidatus Methylacidithermus pantelleriae]
MERGFLKKTVFREFQSVGARKFSGTVTLGKAVVKRSSESFFLGKYAEKGGPESRELPVLKLSGRGSGRPSSGFVCFGYST